MNYSRKTPQFKPYTGRDYEQFKKNYGFGIGHLGYAFDNTNHKEKVNYFEHQLYLFIYLFRVKTCLKHVNMLNKLKHEIRKNYLKCLVVLYLIHAYQHKYINHDG
jgi:hypothetical protein